MFLFFFPYLLWLHGILILPPLEHAEMRVLYKHQGTQVSPTKSPVQPERFRGYHTGTDFETFKDEQERDVAVSAICSGRILRKSTASGYGGYLVQACRINDQDVTVLYGHLQLSSIPVKVFDEIFAGEKLGLLGAGYSKETDGERKHLHLSIRKGTKIDIRGYVQDPRELSGWMDYETLVE